MCALTFSSGYPAGRIGDRGDREIVYVPNVYMCLSGPYKHLGQNSETTLLVKFAFWRGLRRGRIYGKLSQNAVFFPGKFHDNKIWNFCEFYCQKICCHLGGSYLEKIIQEQSAIHDSKLPRLTCRQVRLCCRQSCIFIQRASRGALQETAAVDQRGREKKGPPDMDPKSFY